MTVPTLSLLAQASGCNPGSGGINIGDCFTLGVGSSQSVAEVYDTPATMVNLIISNVFIIAGLLVFVAIVYAGFKFLSDSSKAVDEAKQITKAALAGGILMFIAYWIVRIIEVLTGIENLIF